MHATKSPFASASPRRHGHGHGQGGGSLKWLTQLSLIMAGFAAGFVTDRGMGALRGGQQLGADGGKAWTEPAAARAQPVAAVVAAPPPQG
jgi:hypothetical protein